MPDLASASDRHRRGRVRLWLAQGRESSANLCNLRFGVRGTQNCSGCGGSVNGFSAITGESCEIWHVRGAGDRARGCPAGHLTERTGLGRERGVARLLWPVAN